LSLVEPNHLSTQCQKFISQRGVISIREIQVSWYLLPFVVLIIDSSNHLIFLVAVPLVISQTPVDYSYPESRYSLYIKTAFHQASCPFNADPYTLKHRPKSHLSPTLTPDLPASTPG